MTELEKDLEELLGDGDLVMSTVDVIADRLTRLGYAKVVRCGECAYRSSCECEVCKMHGNERLCCHPLMGVDGIGYVPPEGYCHLGERVEKEVSNEDDNL